MNSEIFILLSGYTVEYQIAINKANLDWRNHFHLVHIIFSPFFFESKLMNETSKTSDMKCVIWFKVNTCQRENCASYENVLILFKWDVSQIWNQSILDIFIVEKTLDFIASYEYGALNSHYLRHELKNLMSTTCCSHEHTCYTL